MRAILTLITAISLWLWPLWASAQDLRFEIADADEDLTLTLRAASLLQSLTERDDATAQDYVAAARADYRRLLTGLYAEGFYGGAISILVDGREAASLDPLSLPPSVSTVRVIVQPGPRFSFGQAAITPLAPATDLPEAFAPGQTARSGVIADASTAAIDGWRAEGRALARVEDQSIRAIHAENRLDVALRLSPGPVLSYGDIGVTGNRNVRAERVLAIAGLKPGTIYDPEEIARAEANLRRTGAFTTANVAEAETAGPNDTLPLTLQVAEQRPRRIGFGAELSTVTGATLSGYWIHRNILGGAERLRLDFEVAGLTGETGGIDYTLAAAFLRPATFNAFNDLYFDMAIEQLDEPNFFQRQVRTEVGIIRRIRNEDILQVGIGYRLGIVDDDLGDRRYQILTLPVEGTRDRRDDPLDATSGYFVNLELMPFTGIEGSANGLRAFGDARVYRSVGQDDALTFALRGQAGAVFGAEADEVPPDFLFFSGGGGTVRGQDFQSLGVDIGGGTLVGGTGFFGLQAEARYDVNDRLGLVGFYDTAFVGPDQFDFGSGDWHSGVGVGVRYDTGIGPIRLDVAVPTTGPDAGERLNIYVGIGQSF